MRAGVNVRDINGPDSVARVDEVNRYVDKKEIPNVSRWRS